MKKIFKKTVSLALAAVLTASVSLPALASESMGDELVLQETLLNQDTQLTANVFWSSAFSDLRTEHYITYEPNREVTPVVTYGDVLTERHTVTSMAAGLEAQGYRVVAGINGDFYNVGTGLPIGLVVTDGLLRSSDSGYYAVGFKANGEAVLGKPAIKVTASLGYEVYDDFGLPTTIVRSVAGVNKSRVSTGGIFLYTHDFNARHTTGTTEPGVDVICRLEEDGLSIGETVELTVEQVLDGVSATPVGDHQVVLSVNEQSDPYFVNALRNVPVGATVTLDISAANEEWEDVEYAVGALYSLVENGVVADGLPTGSNPRTAVGQKSDGTLIFYTVDGRRSGHSIGSTLSQVGRRMIELGCETVVCLDGGGSTTLAVTEPSDKEISVVNIPSEGGERAVTNQIFLVADNRASGQLSHFYVQPEHTHVLAGSRVNISAAAVDTNYIPMETSYKLTADDGRMSGNVLLTPEHTAEITVTASRNGREGSAKVYAVAQPDNIAIRNSAGTIIRELTVAPGTHTQLTGSVSHNHLPLYAEADLFEWYVEGDIGYVDETGVFTATMPGEGQVVVSAGGVEAKLDVTVSKVPLQTVEDFEDEDTIFSVGVDDFMTFTTVSGEEARMGRGAGRLDYTLPEETGFASRWVLWEDGPALKTPYDSLSLWVNGDGSGNQLALLYGGGLELPFLTLDFTGWQQVSVLVPEGFSMQGLAISAGAPYIYDDGLGNLLIEYPQTVRSGTVYVDQIVASLGGAVDSEVPFITAELDEEDWTVEASVRDGVDDILSKDAIAVSLNGEETDFEYDRKTGELTVALPETGESREAMRLTITARDGSGNIGRTSVDIEPFGVEHKFTDIKDHRVDFLYNSGVTTGYEDGTFRPKNNLTRAQFAAMLYRYLGLEEEQYADVVLPFADADSIAEYARPAIRALYTEGVINGSVGKDGRLYFNPNNHLTRAQVVAMVGRTQEKGYAVTELNFMDNAAIPAYAAYYIQTMMAQGVIDGYGDGTFRPQSLVTRGDMANILYYLM